MKNSPLLDLFFGTYKNELVRYASEGGGKMCDECRENSGKIFHVDDTQMPWLPIHPHCRCQYTLAFDTQIIVTSQVEKYRIRKRLKDNFHLEESEAEDLASQIIAARKENPIIREQQRFLLFNGQYLFSSDGEFLSKAASGEPISSNAVQEKTQFIGFSKINALFPITVD